MIVCTLLPDTRLRCSVAAFKRQRTPHDTRNAGGYAQRFPLLSAEAHKPARNAYGSAFPLPQAVLSFRAGGKGLENPRQELL